MSTNLTDLVVSLTGMHARASDGDTADVFETPDFFGWNIFIIRDPHPFITLLYKCRETNTYLAEAARPPRPAHILEKLKRVQDAILVLA